jgi:prepilin-type N-terminal cleavage/methylation domain-containing protein
MNNSKGFTIIELLVAITILIGASILFFVQKSDVESIARDNQTKTIVNAIYYSLEEVFYEANKHYPTTVNSELLPSVDPNLFTDPYGGTVNTADSNIVYTPLSCVDDKCQSYTLRSPLEKEDDFVRTSRNK